MDIKEWGERGGTYEQGLQLFGARSRNRALFQYLMRKRDDAKLRYELGKMAGTPEYVSPVTPASSAEVNNLPENPYKRLIVEHSGTVRVEDMPDPVRAVYDRVCAIYKRMRSLSEKMKLVESDAERAQVRAELVTLEGERLQAWEQIDAWATDGVLPVVQDAQASIPTDAKAVASARASITRNLGLLEKTTDPERISALVERLRNPVAVVLASGGTFSGNAVVLAKHGLI